MSYVNVALFVSPNIYPHFLQRRRVKLPDKSTLQPLLGIPAWQASLALHDITT